MAISDKTRKRLWAKSGNKCAICKVDLFAESSDAETFNIGDECHIISGRVNGPRYKVGLSDYDDFDNLLLLCKIHHKEIDELHETYSEEVLRFMKTSHENFIKRAISTATDKKVNEEKPKFLARITSGKDILEVIWNVHGYNFDYDESESEEDMHYIASFLQNLQDYGELVAMGEIEISQKISIGTELTSYIKNLEMRGFYVFGERYLGNIILHEGENLNNWSIGAVYVKKKESADIVYPEQLFDFLMNKTLNGSNK